MPADATLLRFLANTILQSPLADLMMPTELFFGAIRPL